MNLSRTVTAFRQNNIGRNFVRKFRFSPKNFESTEATQPQVKEEKNDFENLYVLERVERRKPKIKPFMKDIFVSDFNRDLLAYPEILNKEEQESLENRISILEKVFADPEKTKEDRKVTLKQSSLYGAPVNLTDGGLAMNTTESLRYLETIASDVELSQQMSDHWISLEALKYGLEAEHYQQLIGDLTSGDQPIGLCIKERIAERVSQADFRTNAELDSQGIWRLSGEKVCVNPDGFLLVLGAIDAGRLKAFLVHPNARGVSYKNPYISFTKTPATPLDMISSELLARILSKSRLHAAALCRSALVRAVHTCGRYVGERVFSGQPLSELSTIKTIFGDALLDIYASESAEYFTAGLLDGYADPDTEVEAAMCRNFISTHGMTRLLKLLEIQSLELPEQSDQMITEMRQLTLKGETLNSVNMFIALSGIHHAGKMMSQEIKQIRNPLFHPGFILKKVFADRLQEKDEPKLTLYLAEHLHPTLRQPAEQLEYCVLRMTFACETLMSRHGAAIHTAYTELNRLAEAATEILVMTAVLSRASRSYCIGLRNAELEMKLAACFIERSKAKVRQLILEITDGEYLNLDHFTTQFGKRVLHSGVQEVQKPTARVFW